MNSLTAKPRDLSFEASLIAHLSDEQQQRLTDVLDRYLTSLEEGAPLAQADLFAQHPDLASVLGAYLKSLESLHRMAAGFGSAAMAVDPPTDGKRCVGDFELLREIGRGGMGVVYEARQLSLDRVVAVKLLPFSSVLDARQIARFKYEAYAAAQLQHPNIVSVLSVGEDAGVHFYAMPFIQGKPLDQVIAEQRAAPLPRYSSRVESHKARLQAALRIGIQAAEALQAAHESGVVHRDIKPSNLLLEANGKLWMTDFGLARCRRDASLTQTGDLIGTLRYMSPEQAAGKRELVDHRTDVYSLGVTLYELLCLRPAFGDDSGPQLLRQIETQEPPRPRSLRPEISAELETVVLKAMAKGRDDRYATAGELAADLRCVLEGRTIVAKPLGSLEKFGRRLRRHQAVVLATLGLTTAACVALLIGMFLISVEKNRAERNLATADRRFREAREVVDRFGVDLSQRLADVPGAEDVRRDLLRQTQAYYQRLIDESGADPSRRADLATAYGRIASLIDEAGSTDEAIVAHQKAVTLFEELAAADASPAKPAALARNNLAMALGRAGRHEDALKEFAAAIAAQRVIDARGDLALTFSNLGLLQQTLDRTDEARTSFRAAADLLTQLLAAEPSNAEYARRSAAVLNNLAGTYLNTAPQEAIALHQRALALQSAETDDAELTRQRALTLHNLGSAFARTRDVDQAVSYFQQAISLYEGLIARSPGRIGLQRDLAVTCNSLGLVYVRNGELTQAELTLRRSAKIHELLARLAPADAAATSALGSVHGNLAVALERRGRLDDAVEAVAAAIRAQESAAKQSAEYNGLLEKHRQQQARLLRKLGSAEANPIDAKGASDEAF